MTQEEIIQAITNDKMMPFIQPEQLTEIVNFVIKNYQPSLPSNLDEAAEKFAHFYDNGTCDGIAQECFRAGAEWMTGQGSSREVEVKEDAGGYLYIPSIELYDYDTDAPLAKKGDKVVVQIRKK